MNGYTILLDKTEQHMCINLFCVLVHRILFLDFKIEIKKDSVCNLTLTRNWLQYKMKYHILPSQLKNYCSSILDMISLFNRYYKNCCPGSSWNSEAQQCEGRYSYIKDILKNYSRNIWPNEYRIWFDSPYISLSNY